MKKQLWTALLCSAALLGLSSCEDDQVKEGLPTLTNLSTLSSASFGDSIPFTVTVGDRDNVPLSTLKAKLYFSDEEVQHVTIRTKTAGVYEGKIYVPFLKNIPNGTATLKFALQNIGMTITEVEHDLALSRPNYSSLILVKSDGSEVTMERSANNEYSATAVFEAKQRAYIKAAAFGPHGNEITFGWQSGAVTQGSTGNIPFSSLQAGEYTISFNTLTYASAPFIKVVFDGTEMSVVDDNRYKVEKQLSQNTEISVENILGYEDFWIDPDYFTKSGDQLIFKGLTGKYRVTADLAKKYFNVQLMSGDNLASLNADGTGGIYILGWGAGKPNLSAQPGWEPGRGLQIPMVAPKRFQMKVVAGEDNKDGNIRYDYIDFKFFHQDGWGGEFGGSSISMAEGDHLIRVTDSGNVALVEGAELELGATYLMMIDLTAGNSSAKLSLVKQ